MKPSGFACKEPEAKWFNKAADFSPQKERQLHSTRAAWAMALLYHISQLNATVVNGNSTDNHTGFT